MCTIEVSHSYLLLLLEYENGTELKRLLILLIEKCLKIFWLKLKNTPIYTDERNHVSVRS